MWRSDDHVGWIVPLYNPVRWATADSSRSIKGMTIGMGTSWHRKMSRPNELVGPINVGKSEQKE